MYGSYRGREWGEKLPPVCTHCDYNLTGISSEVCPECGKTIYWLDVERNARQVYHSLRQADDLNDLIDLGPYVGTAGAVIILFFWWVGWGDGLGRVIGVCFALMTLGCGLQIVRHRRVPVWARDYIEVEAKVMKALSVIFLAIGILALAVFLP